MSQIVTGDNYQNFFVLIRNKAIAEQDSHKKEFIL